MSVGYYRKKLIDKQKEMSSLRAKIVKIKKWEKIELESLSYLIKITKSISNKEKYRNEKILKLEKYVREEDLVKKEIKSIKREIDNLKEIVS